MRWRGWRGQLSRADWIFVAGGVASLAIGVGANTAIFSITSSLWLRDRGIDRPDQVGMVYFRPVARTDGALVASGTTRECQPLQLLERGSVAFEVLVQQDIGKWMRPRVALARGEGLQATAVSYDYFKVLGVRVTGRGFIPDDDIADRRVVVASNRFARRSFPSDSSAVGRTISLSTGPVTIVGVAPEAFRGTRLGQNADLWLPLGAMPTFSRVPQEVRHLIPLAPLVRLHPGGTWKDVQTQLDELTNGRAVVFSLAQMQYVPTSLGAIARQDQLLRALRLMAALILLATCLTLSGLFIARIGSRRQELAVRLALGSNRWSIARVFLGDAATLVFGGVPISLITAFVVTRSVRQLGLPGGLAVNDLNLSIDWRVGIFGTALAIAAVGVAATLPLYRAVVTEPRGLLTGGMSGGDRSASRSRQWLVAAYVALSVVLAAGAASLVERIAALRYGDQGLDSRALVVTSITPSTEAYLAVSAEGAARVVADFRSALERVRSLPVVEDATYGDAPLASTGIVIPRGLKTSAMSARLPVVVARGGPGYARVIGAQLVAGRDLRAEDTGVPQLEMDPRAMLKKGPPVGAIVDATLAKTLWLPGDAVGSLLDVDHRQCVIVGVMRDLLPDLPGRIRASTVVVGAQPSGWLGSSLPAILVKQQRTGSTSALEVHQTIRTAFMGGSDVRTRTLSQCLDEVTANEQLGARLFAWSGTASSLLGMIGTYGLAALFVLGRKHELAVRAALGATRARLRWMCVARVIAIVLSGTVVGVAIAVGLSHTVQASAVGLGETPASSYVLATLVVLMSGAASAVAGTADIRRIDVRGMLGGSG